MKKSGFRTSEISAVTVDVNKSYTVNLTLEVGEVTQSVTVMTEAAVELQTTDAQVGNVVGGTTLVRLPTLQRDASELLTLQLPRPLTTRRRPVDLAIEAAPLPARAATRIR